MDRDDEPNHQQGDQQPRRPAGEQPPVQMSVAELLRLMERQQEALLLRQQYQRQHQQPAVVDTVKLRTYDGTSDVEDFIHLFQHLYHLYNWEQAIAVAKLKTSLMGAASECANHNTLREIYQALRARFGVTVEEAKRQLLTMETGQSSQLRETADKIKKLTSIAYPELDDAIRGTLALDQFKRVIRSDMSVFLVSRPPHSLDDAVRTCNEFLAAGSMTQLVKTPHRTNNPRLAVMETCTGCSCCENYGGENSAPSIHHTHSDTAQVAGVQATRPAQPVKTVPPTTEVTEMKELIQALQTTVNRCLQQFKQLQTSVGNRHPQNSVPNASGGNSATGNAKKQYRRSPPSPCMACGKWHWYKDCPTRSQMQQKQQRSNTTRPQNQGNGQGPQQ
jgi:hypothetical protein